MAAPHGSFVWYELMTSDVQAAEQFYRAVIGWNALNPDLPGLSYTMFTSGEAGVGGMMTASAGARPGWIGYVRVDDLEQSTAQVSRAGGIVRRPPSEIPGVGRFCIVADPQGGTLALFKPLTSSEASKALPPSLGHAGWNELHATDREAAFAFYSGVFGWTRGEALDMGAMGLYQIFGNGREMTGGIMTRSDAVPGPFWLYYFNVASIDAAVERVRHAGGQILNGPHLVPGGSRIVQCLDPQGALFALVEPGKMAEA